MRFLLPIFTCLFLLNSILSVACQSYGSVVTICSSHGLVKIYIDPSDTENLASNDQSAPSTSSNHTTSGGNQGHDCCPHFQLEFLPAYITPQLNFSVSELAHRPVVSNHLKLHLSLYKARAPPYPASAQSSKKL